MRSLLPLLLMLLLTTASLIAIADPEGVEILSNTTQTVTPRSAAEITTAGGSFTTLLLNATSQTQKWKAYVGNVTGSLALRDAQNISIYAWDLTTVTGEVYASRNESVDWTNIQCAQNSTIAQEEGQLSIITGAIDSINSTFNDTIHSSFYVGTVQISQSTCHAIATYVNDQAQARSTSADFQIVLLDDTQRLVYATILEDDATGYNTDPFDFQLIVAEDPTTSTPSPYYFWAELG